jgi:hypothetical protein
MQLRYELEKKELVPLEYVLNFGRGAGFHGLDPLYTFIAYAESWAFVYFLEHQGYHEKFFNYIKDLKTQGPEFGAAQDAELLVKHLGKNLKELYQEFAPFVKKLVEDTVDEDTYQKYRMSLVKMS